MSYVNTAPTARPVVVAGRHTYGVPAAVLDGLGLDPMARSTDLGELAALVRAAGGNVARAIAAGRRAGLGGNGPRATAAEQSELIRTGRVGGTARTPARAAPVMSEADRAAREAGIRARHAAMVAQAAATAQAGRSGLAWRNPFAQEPGTVWSAPWSTPAERRSDEIKARHARTMAALAPAPPQRRC